MIPITVNLSTPFAEKTQNFEIFQNKEILKKSGFEKYASIWMHTAANFTLVHVNKAKPISTKIKLSLKISNFGLHRN